MELIGIFSDSNFGLRPHIRGKFRIRKAARAVVIDSQGRAVLFHSVKNKYYKLPGGGIERHEDIMTALKREVLEETGQRIKSCKALGITIEYRSRSNILQISFCYLASPIGIQHRPNITESEMKEGFRPEWIPIRKALRLLAHSSGGMYDGKFMVARDLSILKAGIKKTKFRSV